MPWISNINNIYNSQLRKVSGKLTFQIGETIAAKIISRQEDGKNVMVKTADGWQFSALMEEPLINLTELLMRLQVIGYEGGKVKLKIVAQQNKDEMLSEESLTEILRSNNLEDEDKDLLQSMIKYSLPLTRENISKVKSLIDFWGKINNDDGEVPQFIEKYLSGRNIDADSEEGINTSKTLNEFFEEFKNLSKDDILVLEGNSIEFSTENIKSFNTVAREPGIIAKNLRFIERSFSEAARDNSNNTKAAVTELGKDFIEKLYSLGDNYGIETEDNDVQDTLNGDIFFGDSEVVTDTDEASSLNGEIEDNSVNLSKEEKKVIKSIVEIVNQKTTTISKYERQAIKELLKSLPNSELPKSIISEAGNKNINISENKENYREQKVSKMLSEYFENEVHFTDSEVKDIVKIAFQKDTTASVKINVKGSVDTADLVLKEVKSKIEEVKTLISNIVESKDNIKSEAWKGIVDNLRSNINDIKVFNSISGQYYYMDMPVTIYNKDYPCKLIIKDDRRRGKKIDSSNVKMALSISTANMGTIDAYVSVREKSMKVEFKCDDKWLPILNLAKEKLIQRLDKTGYSSVIEVHKREAALDIVSCKDFFDSMGSPNINVKV